MAVPLKNKTAPVAEAALQGVIKKYGAPEYVNSDNGSGSLIPRLGNYLKKIRSQYI